MALFLAIVTLAVAGAVVAIAVPAAVLELRSGANAAYAVHAYDAAETGAARTIAGWDPAWNTRSVGSDTTFVSLPAPVGGTRVSVALTRLNPTTWLIRSLGERVSPAGAVLARRLVSTLVRTVPADSAGADSLARRLRGHAWSLLY